MNQKFLKILSRQQLIFSAYGSSLFSGIINFGFITIFHRFQFYEIFYTPTPTPYYVYTLIKSLHIPGLYCESKKEHIHNL